MCVCMCIDINEPSISIPRLKQSDTYFSPISPAGTTSGNLLLEMLQNSQQQSDYHTKAPSLKDLGMKKEEQILVSAFLRPQM